MKTPEAPRAGSEIPLGRYLIAEFRGCDAARLDDVPFLQEQCVAAALAMGARVVGQHSHHYEPHGVTIVEIGLRVALGARRSDVLWTVVGRSLQVVTLGTGLGVLGAIAPARLQANLLHGVAHD